MKKVLGLAISFCMLFGTVFAKGVYDGDIQLHLGLGLDSAKAVAEVPSDLEKSVKCNLESGSTTVDFELSTWHLFDVNDLIGVGFNLGFSGGIGKTSKLEQKSEVLGESESSKMPSDWLSFASHFNGLIGPAVGFTLNDVIKFDLAVGFAYGLDLYSYEYENYDRYSRTTDPTSDAYMIFGAGFGCDVQAKFFPKSVVSPVLGYRLSSIFSSEVITSNKMIDRFSVYGLWNSVNYIANEIYLGVSFNW